jgi:hypothetical protein
MQHDDHQAEYEEKVYQADGPKLNRPEDSGQGEAGGFCRCGEITYAGYRHAFQA